MWSFWINRLFVILISGEGLRQCHQTLQAVLGLPLLLGQWNLQGLPTHPGQALAPVRDLGRDRNGKRKPSPGPKQSPVQNLPFGRGADHGGHHPRPGVTESLVRGIQETQGLDPETDGDGPGAKLLLGRGAREQDPGQEAENVKPFQSRRTSPTANWKSESESLYSVNGRSFGLGQGCNQLTSQKWESEVERRNIRAGVRESDDITDRDGKGKNQERRKDVVTLTIWY